jgi:hypothetical protein
VIVTPAAVIVPVLVDGPVCWETENVAVPLPAPLDPVKIVIQESLDTTLHPAQKSPVIVIVPLPPDQINEVGVALALYVYTLEKLVLGEAIVPQLVAEGESMLFHVVILACSLQNQLVIIHRNIVQVEFSCYLIVGFQAILLSLLR